MHAKAIPCISARMYFCNYKLYNRTDSLTSQSYLVVFFIQTSLQLFIITLYTYYLFIVEIVSFLLLIIIDRLRLSRYLVLHLFHQHSHFEK